MGDISYPDRNVAKMVLVLRRMSEKVVIEKVVVPMVLNKVWWY